MTVGQPRFTFVAYGAYPLLVLVGAGLATLGLRGTLDPGAVAGIWMLVPAMALMVLEWRFALRDEWRMTKRTFWRRDVKYVTAFVLANILAKPASAFIAVRALPDAGSGVLSALPLWTQVAAAILLFDLLWYVWHRTAHMNRWLWRAHAAHHAAPQLYVVMHLLFHPIDIAVILTLQLVVFQLSGISTAAAMVVVMISGLQGVVGHTNLDLRFGPLNYLFSTTELHRNHHSADPSDAGNFGSITSIWDQVFGTFVYHPQRVPARLGLTDPATFPDPEGFHSVMAWPFTAPRSASAA